MPSQIMKCVCLNDYQDKQYGKGNRVFNKTKGGWRCTSCMREIRQSSIPAKDGEKTGK